VCTASTDGICVCPEGYTLSAGACSTYDTFNY
jgi:hypothetical protein